MKTPFMKPLFIPLKTEFFEQFRTGKKDTEYRRYGPHWNAETCPIGRPVVVARGYGWPRLRGVISEFHYDGAPEKLPGWTKCYGTDAKLAVCIKIKLDPL